MTGSLSKVSARGIKVVRDGRAIVDVEEIQVESSEILAVVGPNGAGKSTLLRVLALLLRPDAGVVHIGKTRAEPGLEFKLRRQLACVFQSPLLLDRTVYANVELGLALRRIDKVTRQKHVDKWLDVLGLGAIASQRAVTLSGGEAQRVNLARALALRPEVLFMDEPLGGLDTPTRHLLLDEIGPLVREGAGAGLLVTHDRRVAMALGDRVAVILDGAIRQIGPPEEVFGAPVDIEVAKFVGVENLLPASASRKAVRLDGEVDLACASALEGEVMVCLRAEEIHFGDIPQRTGDWNALEGTVVRLARRGDGFGVEVDVGCKLYGRVTRAQQTLLGLRPGGRVSLSIRPEAVHLIPSP